MPLENPFFLAFFFSLFHAFGGAAVGRAIRTLATEPENSLTLFIWGGIMGLGPLVFDWFFLIREGHLAYGLIGPSVFVVVALVGGFFWRGALAKLDGAAMAATTLGSASVVIGVALIPFMLTAARERQLELADWIFAPLMLLMFLGIGGGFAWTGMSAILHSRTFEQETKLRARASELPASKSKRKKS